MFCLGGCMSVRGRRRIADADRLATRRAVTGEVLAPVLPRTAAAFQRGEIGGEHVRIVRQPPLPRLPGRPPPITKATNRPAPSASPLDASKPPRSPTRTPWARHWPPG